MFFKNRALDIQVEIKPSKLYKNAFTLCYDFVIAF